jgi:hypothetical protein
MDHYNYQQESLRVKQNSLGEAISQITLGTNCAQENILRLEFMPAATRKLKEQGSVSSLKPLEREALTIPSLLPSEIDFKLLGSRIARD